MPKKTATAAPYTLMTLACSALQVDTGIQPRLMLNSDMVETYATRYQEADDDEDPMRAPLDVFQVGKSYYVADGFHRLQAAKQASRETVPCHVYKGTRRDAMVHAAFANLDQRGLPYNSGDTQQVLERLLADPAMAQRGDRALARDLGVSRMTVGRARRRLTAEAALKAQWRAVPLTQTQDHLRRQEQVATFLEVEPAVLASYEKLRQPLDEGRLIPWVARTMTDKNASEADAKASVRASLQKTVQDHKQASAVLRQARPPKATPEERARREALEAERWEQWQRTSREQHLRDIVQRFATLTDGIREDRGPGPCTFADLLATLSPYTWTTLPELLSQAEGVIQTLRDALAGSLAPAEEA